MQEPIYLDNHATTQVDERVIKKMLPYFNDHYGNPSGINSIYGQNALSAVKKSRETIAKILGCKKENEIIFTSGATESNNLSIIGLFKKLSTTKGKHIISTQIEHPSVLNPLNYLQKSENAEISLISVDKRGTINLKELESAIRKDTILISVMFANNEIGTLQPIKKIGEIAKNNNIIFHTDAAQAVGHCEIDVYKMNIDLLSLSGHKFYGPKGIGALFIRSFSPRVAIEPIFYGGEQERNLRSGTLNVPGIVGLAEALKISIKEHKAENKKNYNITNIIMKKLKKEFPDIKFNGNLDNKLAHNLNITIHGVEAKALIHLLKDKLSFSDSSACSTINVKPSHVLKAIGLSDEETFQTIRLGVGRFINKTDAEKISYELILGIKYIKENITFF